MAAPIKLLKVTTSNYESSEDSREFDVTSESESEGTRPEDSGAESNSSNQSYKMWFESLGLEMSMSSQDEKSLRILKILNKIHLVHAMNLVHAMKH
jgi:hypothetical protein